MIYEYQCSPQGFEGDEWPANGWKLLLPKTVIPLKRITPPCKNSTWQKTKVTIGNCYCKYSKKSSLSGTILYHLASQLLKLSGGEVERPRLWLLPDNCFANFLCAPHVASQLSWQFIHMAKWHPFDNFIIRGIMFVNTKIKTIPSLKTHLHTAYRG